jgi:hypothetical protein
MQCSNWDRYSITAVSSWTQVQLRRTALRPNLHSQLTTKKQLKNRQRVIMHHFATALCAGIMATVVVGGTALTPNPAQAAKTSSAEAVALKEATTACKSEAKEKKISWPASRKFVSNCVAKTVKFTPAQLQEIAVKQATVACKAEAKGKKIRWPASRKYVKDCITTALKDHPTMNISEVRRGVNLKTLRVHQRPEWGCEGMTSGRATGC